MNGQTKLFNERQKIMEEFILASKPYEKTPKLQFDLRGYSKYLKEHNIAGNTVPKEVVEFFKK